MRPSKLASVASGIALVAYPLFAYFALTHLAARWAAVLLLVAVVPAALRSVRAKMRAGSTSREGTSRPGAGALTPLAWVPFVTVALLLGSAVLDVASGTLLVPVAISVALGSAFGWTLWKGPPMIERFARLQVADLDASELTWCHRWTWAWVVFFVVNGGIALATVFAADLEAWTTYNGLVSYVLIGTLLGVEYTARKVRFGRLGDHPLDRLLGWTFSSMKRRNP